MRTAAAYLRVSDERQDEYSPDSQLKLIRQYCQQHEIFLPDELIFYDDGISAKSTQKRTRFNEMIALAKSQEKPFQMILVWKFSRFARNQEESIVYKSLLRRNGVEVISVSEPLADNPFGSLVERIIEWMDEYYLIRLGDEVRRGMTERAVRGLPNVPPPYGYRMENGIYVIKAQEAETVRTIFTWFLQGKTLRRIVCDLKALGIKNKHGNFFDPRGIDYILHNPCYAGMLRYNPNERSASARKFNHPDDILTQGTHTPIVSKQVFETAQKKLQERAETRQKYARDSFQGTAFALKGLVLCDTCGATLVYQKANHGVQCHRYAKGKCSTSHFISLSALCQMLRDALREILPNLSVTVAQSPQAPMPPAMDYDLLLRAEEIKLERAKQLYLEGVDSLNDYRRSKETILLQMNQLQTQKIQSTKKESEHKKTVPFLTNLFEILESSVLSEELKNLVLKALLQKIVFYKAEQKLALFFYA